MDDLRLKSELLNVERLKEFQDEILHRILKQVQYYAEHGISEITDPNDANYGPIKGFMGQESNDLQYMIDNQETPPDYPSKYPYVAFTNIIQKFSKDNFLFHIIQKDKALVTMFEISTRKDSEEDIRSKNDTSTLVQNARSKRVQAQMRAALNTYQEVITQMLGKSGKALETNLLSFKEHFMKEEAIDALRALKSVAIDLEQADFVAKIEEFESGNLEETKSEEAMENILKFTWKTYKDLVNKMLPEGMSMPEIKVNTVIHFRDTMNLEETMRNIFKGISTKGLGGLIYMEFDICGDTLTLGIALKKFVAFMNAKGIPFNPPDPVSPIKVATTFIGELKS